MAKSTQVVTDLTTTTTTAFSATEEGRAISASGPITSLEGQVALALLKAQELKTLLAGLIIGSDGVEGSNGLIRSGETNYTELSSVWEVLV